MHAQITPQTFRTVSFTPRLRFKLHFKDDNVKAIGIGAMDSPASEKEVGPSRDAL